MNKLALLTYMSKLALLTYVSKLALLTYMSVCSWCIDTFQPLTENNERFNLCFSCEVWIMMMSLWFSLFFLHIVLRLQLREDFKSFQQPSLDIARSFSSWWLSHQRIGARHWSQFWWAWWRSGCFHGETRTNTIYYKYDVDDDVGDHEEEDGQDDLNNEDAAHSCFSVEEQAAVWWVLSAM